MGIRRGNFKETDLQMTYLRIVFVHNSDCVREYFYDLLLRDLGATSIS